MKSTHICRGSITPLDGSSEQGAECKAAFTTIHELLHGGTALQDAGVEE